MYRWEDRSPRPPGAHRSRDRPARTSPEVDGRRYPRRVARVEYRSVARCDSRRASRARRVATGPQREFVSAARPEPREGRRAGSALVSCPGRAAVPALVAVVCERVAARAAEPTAAVTPAKARSCWQPSGDAEASGPHYRRSAAAPWRGGPLVLFAHRLALSTAVLEAEGGVRRCAQPRAARPQRREWRGCAARRPSPGRRHRTGR